MPAKPVWYRNLSYIVEALRKHPHPYIDRATLEFLLGVGRRRAQQILAPCVVDRVGTSGLADRDALITRLERSPKATRASMRSSAGAMWPTLIGALRQERIAQPQLLVEAPTAVVNQAFETLPAGVRLEPGRILVEFDQPQQGLEKLLALAMAISNDFDNFERCVRRE